MVIQSFDSYTGNPSVVASLAAPAVEGDYVKRALEHVQKISPLLGLTAQAPEFTADPAVQTTSASARAVHLQQRYKGIPIFQAATAVRFAPNGSVSDTAGSTVSVSEDTAVAPKLSVQDAVLKAAQHVAEPAADELDAKDQFGQPLTPRRVDITGFTPSTSPEILAPIVPREEHTTRQAAGITIWCRTPPCIRASRIGGGVTSAKASTSPEILAPIVPREEHTIRRAAETTL